jgi:Cobalamin biosynthesis protein CobT VWA domain
MLRKGIPKENIDGEALVWTHDRLRARAEERRILMFTQIGRIGDRCGTRCARRVPPRAAKSLLR